MGSTSLSDGKSVSKLLLYQRAIQLFHSYKKTRSHKPFNGPFRAIGLNDYRLSPKILNSHGIGQTPDIVASNNTFWIAFELTVNPDSKEPQLNKYKDLDYHHLSYHGLKTPPVTATVLSGRVDITDDGPFCQIILSDQLDARKTDELKNKPLENVINSAIGTDMSALPELPFTLLPEMKSQDLRVGLAEQVIQLFDPLSQGKKATDFVKEGLERLDDKVTIQDKEALIKKVDTQLAELARGQLKDYLELTNGVYRAKKGVPENPKARLTVVNRIKEWSGIEKTEVKVSYQTYLQDY